MTDPAHSASKIVSIGVGGWAYLPFRHGDRLQTCSKLYDFVEVNSTFYNLPPTKLAEKWRSSVADDFEFTVRANRKLTHENHLEPSEDNFKEHARNLAICKVLRAPILHFQFPPSFVVTEEILQGWRGFFRSARRETNLSYAFEIRNEPSANNSTVKAFLDDFNIVPTSDPFRSETRTSSKSRLMYSRVFGRGDHTKWSFSTEELEELKDKVVSIPAAKKYVTFHNITMYEDAARMKEMLRPKGAEPKSQVSALESLKEAIVAERIEYPVTSQDLSSRLAWRTITLNDGRRVHANEITRELPQGDRFDSLEQILSASRSIIKDSPAGSTP